jgi:hypothetical protein
MKRRNSLEIFISETLLQDKVKSDRLLKEFLDLEIQNAIRNLKSMPSEEAQKTSTASTATTAKVGAAGKESEPKQKPKAEEDDDVETKFYINDKDKITLLQKSDKDFKLIAFYSNRVANNLTSVVSKMSTDKRAKVKNSITKVNALQQTNMNKHFQMLSDSFKDAGDEQGILKKISMLAIITKAIQDMEKSSK